MSRSHQRVSLRRKKRSRSFGMVSRNVLIALSLLACSGLTAWLFFREPAGGDKPSLVEVTPPKGDDSASKTDWVIVGGVSRPISDVPLLVEQKRESLSGVDNSGSRIVNPYGGSPKLVATENKQIEAAHEAIATGTQSQRISPTVLPENFDAESFRRSPEEYISKVEPGRVWQSAQPGEEVPVLIAVGPTFQKMNQGESVTLRVRTAPSSPVTFTSFDMGAFENRLPSITALADGEGIAEAIFTATTGTHHLVNVLTASPLASGTQRFQLDVAVPLASGALK